MSRPFGFAVALLAAGIALGAPPGQAAPFRWANDGDANSMDPYTRSETFLLSFTQNIYEPLVRRGRTLKVEPALAERWEQPNSTTWRFHLRGEAIRSAHDVGWMRNLTVGRMMRRELRRVPSDMTLAAFRREFPLGSMNRVIAIDEKDRYAGIVFTAEAHAAPEGTSRVSEILHHPRTVLLPQMTIKEAVQTFEAAESDALAVVEGAETMRVIGVLTEQHALRRYSEELDKRRRELSGE